MAALAESRAATHNDTPYSSSEANRIDHVPELDEKGWIRDRLRHIWADMFEDDPSNFFDDDIFFEVGGNSITAQKLIESAQENGFLLTIRQIFLNPSLQEMADVAVLLPMPSTIQADIPTVTSQIKNQEWMHDVAVHFSPHAVENAYPCTPMQQALAAETDGSGNAYLRQFVFEVAQDVSLDTLRQAWEDTIVANPVLRTRIRYLGPEVGYVQAIVRGDLPSWTLSRGNLAQYLQQDAQNPMVLGDAFTRYTVITTDDNTPGIAQKYFVWSIHHAICDGVSITEVLAEVAARFERVNVAAREPFELFVRSSPLNLDFNEEESFWKASLSQINPPPFPVPSQVLDFRADPSSTVEGRLEFQYTPLAGYTRGLLLQAAWAILLHHYAGTEDVGFGIINNGRQVFVPGVSRMTGPTINLVPVALRVYPEEPVFELLSRMRKQAADTTAFEHTGLSKIRKYLAGSGSTAADIHNLLVIQPARFEEAILPASRKIGLRYLDGLGKKEHHPFPLVVTLTLATDDSIDVMIQHDKRLMPTTQAQLIIHHLQAILGSLSKATKETRTGAVSPLSDADLAQITVWNNDIYPPADTCLHELFKRQAHIQPNAVAVCSLEKRLTYAEVDEYSSSLALDLIDQGCRVGTYVGICFEKSVWTVVAVLAVFKAGGVYVPIDPGHPHDRIREVVQTVGIELAISTPASSPKLIGLGQTILIVSESSMERYAGNDPPSRALASTTAYLLFTSGSTGKPKGILISHSAICTSIIYHGKAFGASTGWRTLQFASHTFDLSICEFFTTLVFGGCICIPTDHGRLNDLAGIIRSLHVNTLVVVPTVANLLTPTEVPSLRTIIVGGEPVTKETILRWASHVDLTCAYGPSECAVWSSANLRVSKDANPTNIGKSIGAKQWIVDPHDCHKLTAIGCVGEIVLSGGILGQGYYGNKALTDQAWVEVPDWLRNLEPDSSDQTVYRSGDLARYNFDGTYHIVGRRDTQVKLRGFRIELGEIENEIMANGTATAAIAVLPVDGPCAKQITAVVSFSPTQLNGVGSQRIELSDTIQSPSTREALGIISHHLSLVLPEYMVPSVWVVLDKMPLLISGKVDRKAIKMWINTMNQDTYTLLHDHASSDEDFDIEPGSVADNLRQLWAECLAVSTERVKSGTSFFELGGDSVAAIQIVAKARQLGVTLTVREIISSKTLGNLALRIQQSQMSQPGVPIEIEQPAETLTTNDILKPYEGLLQARLEMHSQTKVLDAYLLSPFQREIMKQRLLNPSVFLISWQMEIISKFSDQKLSLEKLARAWKQVVQKFPVLRSIYLRDEQGILPPLQVVLSNVEPAVATVTNASEEPEPTWDTLSVPPVDDCFLPHRAQFTQQGEKFLINIQLDHLTIDGWSLRLIKTAFLEAYEAGNNYILEVPPSYKTYIQSLQENRVQSDSRYWEEILKGQAKSLLTFPPVLSHPQAKASPKKTIIYLPEIDAKGLTAFSVQNNVTPASIFDAAWAQTLSIYTGSPNVSFEYVIAGREEDVPDAFEITGLMINVLCYHLEGISTVDKPGNIANLARTMQDQRVQDMLHGSINIRELVEHHLGVEKLFNTAVNFQRRPTAVETALLRIDDDLRKSVDPWHLMLISFQFDVLVRVLHITDDATFRTSLEFDAQMFDDSRMQEVAEHWFNRVQNTIS
ncbi:Nonribosomal peptide synthetase easA [Paramyrothecium foliicola]|nr:Nonribosomal peptide synthetase easA [Paramyrothecium foliicola]